MRPCIGTRINSFNSFNRFFSLRLMYTPSVNSSIPLINHVTFVGVFALHNSLATVRILLYERLYFAIIDPKFVQ